MVLSTWLTLTLRLTVLVLALQSTITAVPGSDNVTGQDGDFRRKLGEVMERLCPYDKSCHGEEPRLQLNAGMESCCTECSCEDTCGLTESCCYPEQAAITYFDRSNQQCEPPSSLREGRSSTKKHFYMVTSGYVNGSSEHCKTGNVTCGEYEAGSVLGSLYPVSSKSTGVIYKNEQCARCHGVARGDMVPWEAELMCMLGGDRLDTLVQSLETGRVNPACRLDFYYPGPKSDVNVHVCYENTIRSCLQFEGRSYNLPSYLNMTDDEVRSACLNGPQTQYKELYNLFCYLCQYGRHYKAENQCVRKSLGDRSPGIGSFSALLRPRNLQNRAAKGADTDTKEHISPVPIACKRALQTDTDDCRPVLCPSGQVRLDSRRQCVYPDKTLLSRTFMVHVELYPGTNRSISPLIGYLNSNLQQGKDWRAFFSAPDLDTWRLSVLCYHDHTEKARNKGTEDFFWLQLTLETVKSSSLAKILAKVEQFMTGDWEFVVNMTSIRLEQRFSEVEEVIYDKTTSAYKQHYADELDPEMNCTYSDRRSRGHSSIHVTKTFFCDQVALQQDEYVLDKGSKRLYVNATGRVFSPAEYMLGYDARGDTEPRLCLEDTDYVLMPQQNPASLSGALAQNHWSILALVVIAQLMGPIV